MQPLTWFRDAMCLMNIYMYFFIFAIWAWNIYLFRLAYIAMFRPLVFIEHESSSDEDTGTPIFGEPE